MRVGHRIEPPNAIRAARNAYVALSSARCCVLFVCLLVAVPSLTQDIDRLAHTVVFLYRTEQRPVVKDGKRGMETDTEFGTGFLFTPDDKSMFLVTAKAGFG